MRSDSAMWEHYRSILYISIEDFAIV